MKRDEAIRTVGEFAAEQWGLFTTAQAEASGVGKVALLRLREAELVTSVGRGVHLMAGAAYPEHLPIKVAWLQLDPARPAWERLRPGAHGGVVARGSACEVHQLGDIPSTTVELSVPRKRTTRLEGVRLRHAVLPDTDVVVVDGLPVTTAERTITDLLAAHADGGHIGGVIADAEQRGLVDRDRLTEAAARYAHAYGLPRAAKGEDLLRHLIEQTGARPAAIDRERELAAKAAGFASAVQLFTDRSQLGALEKVLLDMQNGPAQQIAAEIARSPAFQLAELPQFQQLRAELLKAVLPGTTALEALTRDLTAPTAALAEAFKALYFNPVLETVFRNQLAATPLPAWELPAKPGMAPDVVNRNPAEMLSRYRDVEHPTARQAQQEGVALRPADDSEAAEDEASGSRGES